VTAATHGWAGVVGQDDAIAKLDAQLASPAHAYLFVGPPGTTKHEAARLFAGRLVATDERSARLALEGQHPDVREFARVGPAISREQADEIIKVASRAPTEGARKVLILDEFHLLTPDAAAKLLKTIEEPPASTTFVVIADMLPPDLVTIASRCIRIDFRPLSDDLVASTLAGEGIAADRARSAAEAAGGDLTRARLLAHDDGLAARHALFAAIPRRLDGSGSTVARMVDELLQAIDAAAAPMTARHADEAAEVEARIAALGERGSGRKALEERHRRELRRHRTDELKAGLAVLARTYRDAAMSAALRRIDDLGAAMTRINATLESMERNPNETLMLQALLLDLPALAR
jgi:DNA polymerase-3 subunit delta'